MVRSGKQVVLAARRPPAGVSRFAPANPDRVFAKRISPRSVL